MSSKRRELKQQQRETRIVNARSLLSNVGAMELQGNLPGISELAARIRSKEITVLQLVQTVAQKVLDANEKYNFLTEIMIAEAIEDAKTKDAYLNSLESVKDLPPFFGIPISLKDNVNVQGFDSSLAYSSFTNSPMSEDGKIVKILRNLGFIPLVKTNVPQTLLTPECSNPVFGTTTNPHNTNLTPGGSSGGEGAILASGASLIGIGNDVAGSLRIPAHFSGIVAIKPSSHRIPLSGIRGSSPGQEAIVVVNGPMGRSVTDVRDLLRAIVDSKPWTIDSACVPIPWNPAPPKSRRHIGYFIDNGFVPCSPACKRAVELVVEKLRQEGHHVVEFKPPDFAKCMSLAYGLLSADGGQRLLSPLKGDPIDDAVKRFKLVLGLWWPVRWLLKTIAQYMGSRVDAMMLEYVKEKTVEEYWELTHQRNVYRDTFFDAWDSMTENGSEMDAIICPVNSLPAIRFGDSGNITAAASYTVLFNILDCSAGVVPVTKVDAEIDVWRNDKEVDMAEKQLRGAYDAQIMQGAPVGVQIVGKRYEEEKVLDLMLHVESLL